MADLRTIIDGIAFLAQERPVISTIITLIAAVAIVSGLDTPM